MSALKYFQKSMITKTSKLSAENTNDFPGTKLKIISLDKNVFY